MDTSGHTVSKTQTAVPVVHRLFIGQEHKLYEAYKIKLKISSMAAQEGLVPRYPLQKPPSRGLEGSGGRGLYIRGLGMCKACTEAVHSEAL